MTSHRYKIKFIAQHYNGRILHLDIDDTEQLGNIEVFGRYLSPKDGDKERWEILKKVGAIIRAVYLGDTNGWTNYFRESFPTKPQNHQNTTSIVNGI